MEITMHEALVKSLRMDKILKIEKEFDKDEWDKAELFDFMHEHFRFLLNEAKENNQIKGDNK
jgi:hypothetical protein